MRAAAVQDGRLAAILGHELRNPLAAAVTGASLLRELLEPGDPRAAVADGILRDLGRLGRLLDGYLDFARSGAPRRGEVPVAALCHELARRHGGAVAVDVPADLLALADPALLERLLENLVENALHAGARSVRLHAAAAGPDLRLQVVDDGPGVPAELADRVFEPGFSRRGGTGLGLGIVAAIARGHGGTVRCLPEARGARFVVDLPRAVPAACANPA